MGFITELYYGNIRPNEKCFNRSGEFGKAMRLFCDSEKELEKALADKELRIFHNLINASDEISAITNLENFKIGFRLGVRMICDSLLLNGDEIFRDIE